MDAKMTYVEYEKIALAGFEQHKSIPPEYINEVKKRNCIRHAYNEDLKVTELLGTDQINPTSFAFGCHMLYPDFPDGDETETDKPVFGFKFNAVRK